MPISSKFQQNLKIFGMMRIEKRKKSYGAI